MPAQVVASHPLTSRPVWQKRGGGGGPKKLKNGLSLVYAYRKVVHCNLPKNTSVINDEQSPNQTQHSKKKKKKLKTKHLHHANHTLHKRLPQSVAQVFQENTVVLWDLLRQVGQERYPEALKTSLLTLRVEPGEVGVLWVHRAGHHRRVQGREFIQSVAEG